MLYAGVIFHHSIYQSFSSRFLFVICQHQLIHEARIYLFFVGGQTLKPPLKAVTWAGKAEALLQVLDSALARVGLQMCLRLWVGF